MTWLNMNMIGRSGHTNHILHDLITTRQVEQARSQIKMLSGDYLMLDRMVRDRQ